MNEENKSWLNDFPFAAHVEKQGELAARLRISYRYMIGLLFILVLGIFTAAYPGWFLNLLRVADVNINLGESVTGMFHKGLQVVGLLAALYSSFRILYIRLANRYFMMYSAVSEETGFIARRVSQVELSHVRTVEVEQSVLERILNIGTVRFATAGTGETDVTWRGIRDPVLTQQSAMNRLRDFSGDGSEE